MKGASLMANEKNIFIPGVKDGETFKVGEMEFIKFPDKDGMTPVVMKDIVFQSHFGRTNNFKESDILQRMKEEILPDIVEAIGEENLCPVTTDLTSLDGLKDYGAVESLIALPTLDFYRENAENFQSHKLNCWWWLATPWSTPANDDDWCVLCVSPSGCIRNFNYCNDVNGVRPFLIFKSCIFGSPEA